MTELKDIRVLILEPESRLAEDWKQVLMQAGCSEVVLTTRVDDAADAIFEQRADVAFFDLDTLMNDLDHALGAIEFAETLNIPFMLVVADRTRPLSEHFSSDTGQVEKNGLRVIIAQVAAQMAQSRL